MHYRVAQDWAATSIFLSDHCHKRRLVCGRYLGRSSRLGVSAWCTTTAHIKASEIDGPFTIDVGTYQSPLEYAR